MPLTLTIVDMMPSTYVKKKLYSGVSKDQCVYSRRVVPLINHLQPDVVANN